ASAWLNWVITSPPLPYWHRRFSAPVEMASVTFSNTPLCQRLAELGDHQPASAVLAPEIFSPRGNGLRHLQ
ncbi:hypothetical protein CQA73_28475, partial [Escherichia coli]